MMIDQAEEIRRRLEARASGQPLPPPVQEPAPEPIQPSPPSQPTIHPQTAARARQLKMEAAMADISNAQPVVVVDIKIKFFSLVILMVKVAFAAIPASIIVGIVWYTLIMMLAARH